MQAWLNLTPENSSTTNGDRYGNALPDIQDEYCYLPEFLHQIGTAGHGFDRLVPLTFAEIEAWSRMTGAELNRFEAETIRMLSITYCSIANDRNSECPVQDGEVHEIVQEANIATWMAAGRS